jgi:hypothetical protein
MTGLEFLLAEVNGERAHTGRLCAVVWATGIALCAVVLAGLYATGEQNAWLYGWEVPVIGIGTAALSLSSLLLALGLARVQKWVRRG